MPSGKTHAIATFSLIGATASGMAYYKFDVIDIVTVCVGELATLYINPDLDLDRPFLSNSPKTWLAWIYMYPYRKVFAHRSFFSHFPVVSTLIRVFYFGWPLALLAWKSQYNPPENTVFLLVLGMMISDATHWAMDMTTTKIKRSKL